VPVFRDQIQVGAARDSPSSARGAAGGRARCREVPLKSRAVARQVSAVWARAGPMRRRQQDRCVDGGKGGRKADLGEGGRALLVRPELALVGVGLEDAKSQRC
jgi:hypothetical protein